MVEGKRLTLILYVGILILALFLSGCPLPFVFSGEGAGDDIPVDPSAPTITAPVSISFNEMGGSSGDLHDGEVVFTADDTVISLSTETENAVIYYTVDGSSIASFDSSSVRRISSSNGSFTIPRTTGVETRDIVALAVGSGMLPSPLTACSVTVSPFPVITLSVDDETIQEDGGSTTVRLTASQPPETDLTIPVVLGGTFERWDISVFGAEPGSYSPGESRDLTISAGETQVTTSLWSAGDPTEYENDTVTFTIDATGDPGYVLGSETSVTVEIIDNSLPMISIGVDFSGLGDEPGALNTFRLTSSVVVDTDLTVQLTTSGSYEAGDIDGIPGPGGSFNVTIPAETSTASVEVSLNYDAGEFDNETVQISVTDGAQYNLGDPATASFTINDTSPVPRVSLTVDSTFINDTQVANFLVSADQIPEVDTVINLSPAGMTTAWVAGPIYNTVTLLAGENEVPFELDPRNLAGFDPQTATYTIIAGTGYTLNSPTSQSVAVQDDAIPMAGLTAYYPLNGNAEAGFAAFPDGSTANTTPATSRHGIAGNAISFNGSNSSVTIPVGTIGGALSTGSISIWILYDGGTPLRYYFTIPSRVWGLWTQGETAGLAISTPSTSSASGPFPANEWAHLVGVYDGGSIYFYVNGALVGTRHEHFATTPPAGPISLGVINTSYWPGSMDDLRVYNRALSAAEIVSLSNE